MTIFCANQSSFHKVLPSSLSTILGYLNCDATNAFLILFKFLSGYL
jgi:hypothetical protein